MKSIRLLFVLLFLQQTFCGFSQNNLPSFITDSLDNYVNNALKKESLPGLAICIVKDGKVVWMKGYGVKEWGKSDRVNENTLFMIGSNTKAFTAVSLALLETEGKLSLNDRVTKWIPEFRLDNELAGQQAIIRDVLSHRIGFRTFQGDFTYWKSDLTREDVIERMSHIKAVYPFRTLYGYCNAGFVVAGQIIPRATGIQWEDFVKQRIFDPLGMDHSLALSKDLMNAENKTVPHDIVNGTVTKVPYGILDNLGPAGSISSSVNDLSKWMIMLLNKGEFQGKQVIPQRVFDEVWYPHTIVGKGGTPFNKGHFNLYGLGFGIREYEGHIIISHGGAVTGYLSTVTMIPDQKLGIAILTNSIRNTIYFALSDEIIDAFLGLPYRNYEQFYNNYDQADNKARLNSYKQYEDSVALNLKSDLPLNSYTGKYSNEVYGNMEVVVENQELHMKFSHHAGLDVLLRPLGKNRFYAVFNDPEFETAVFPFQTENGKAKSVTVKLADFIEYTPYIFTKQGEY